ncbi:hypothetical protein Taro_005243 [Colocasia esculenta]|uniref:Uncharacterized protein n=1 Tax=Colocasia esculenta TaxID=4460 RepID=A0A843TU10_COLES|nr:hypothetical protein [Colocasia esculenta]
MLVAQRQVAKPNGHRRHRSSPPSAVNLDLVGLVQCSVENQKEETKVDEDKNSADELTNASSHDKKKQKRKRQAVKDLRFQDLDQVGGGARKQKRKEYFEARKKKQKKEKKSEMSEFPKHDLISFGEVVVAPPRLSFPKFFYLLPVRAVLSARSFLLIFCVGEHFTLGKLTTVYVCAMATVHDASHERRRLRVIEAYRNNKGWESRPGIHLPSITEALSPQF